MRRSEWDVDGRHGRVVAREWTGAADPRHLVLLSHGYGEHVGRYDAVAAALVDAGAVVVGPDHAGHGRSDGTSALVRDVDDLVADLHAVARRAAEHHVGLPTVLLGHSMGGLVAARYSQVYRDELAALVLSAPVLGRWSPLEALLGLPVPPGGLLDVPPIDPAVLSRDPAVGRAYAADPLVWHGPFRRATLEALRDGLARVRGGAGLAGLPVLWVHGEADQLVPLADTRTGVEELSGADVRERTWPGARHELLNETVRDEVLDEVRRFADEVLGAVRA